MHQEAARLFLVDDDPSVLRAVTRLLRVSGYEVEAFSSPRLFLERDCYDGLGCLIVDLQMPEMSGLELQQAVLAKGYALPILFLTGHGDIPTTVRALKAGAVDFLTKPFATEQLLTAVNGALDSHREALAARSSVAELKSRFELLTQREQEVCVLVGRGLLNKQIAFELGAAEKTIKLHRARVMKKLQVRSVPELVDLLRAIGTR